MARKLTRPILQQTLQTIHIAANMYFGIRSISKSRRLRITAISFPDHPEGILVVFQSTEFGMPRVVGPSPLQEFDLRDQLRPQPNTPLHFLRSGPLSPSQSSRWDQCENVMLRRGENAWVLGADRPMGAQFASHSQLTAVTSGRTYLGVGCG